jgi:membrane protein
MNRLFSLYENFMAGYRDADGKPDADSPLQFQFKDWKKALLAAKTAITGKRLSILAAGIAYFMTLAFFPLMAAGVGIASFVIDGDQLTAILNKLQAFLPADIASLISTQLATALQDRSSSLLIIVFGILIALFSISGAVGNLLSASNASYEVEETRSFVKLRLTSLTIMLAGAVAGVVVVGLLLLTKPLLAPLGVPELIITVVSILRWFVIAGVIALFLAFFYRYAPNRAKPYWQWVSWGSVLASVLWLSATALFFVYARYFADFSESYSVFAGIIVLMTWLNVTALIVLLGAEVNYRLEKQTSEDTTE